MIVRRCLLIASALSCVLSASGRAEPVDPPADMAEIKHQHCEDQLRNLNMTFCMSREREESDQRLNVVYQTLMHSLVKPQSLQKVQRAWIAFRDAECKFQNESMQGGSGYNFSMDLCLVQLTEQRIAALERVRPCNGCVEFKAGIDQKDFDFPARKRIPASGEP